MNPYPALIAILFTCGQPGVADDSVKEFETLVKANTHTVEFDGRSAKGPGIDWLVQEGGKAQYFLVGERHGLAEIPKISSAIFAGLAGVGYRHAALEFGPFAAIQVEAALRDGGFPALEQYLTSPTGHNSVAFLDWREEAQMAAEMFARSTNKHGLFWGLDQEFAGAFSAHLAFLEDASETETQRAAIAEMQAGLGPQGYFVDLAPDQLKRFLDLFRDHTSEQVRALAQAMTISHFIYGPWATPSRLARAESNIVREDHMKDNFLARVRATKKQTGNDPKVFFKFGGFHAAPSIDTRNGRILLGTFIEAYARTNGHVAFNLFIECYSGANRSSGQDSGKEANVKQSCGSYFGKVDAHAPPNDERHMFSEYLDGSDRVLLVDLRPLRMHMNRFEFLSTDARELLVGFDAYMAIPNATESTPFVQQPARD